MKTIQRTTFFTLLLLLMTSIHHIYGAVVYHTHWRLHVVLIAVPVGALVWVLYYLYTRSRYSGNKAVLISYLLSVLVFPALLIGVYEGVYNHLIKNIIFPFTGNSSFFRMLFPPPVYEMPNNVLFEATGVLQAFILYPLLHNLWRWWKHRQWQNSDTKLTRGCHSTKYTSKAQ